MAKITDIQRSLEINFIPFLTGYTEFLKKYYKEILVHSVRENIKKDIIDLIFELKELRAKRVPYDSITTSIIQLNKSAESNDSQGFAYLLAYIMECIREILADRSILSSNNKVFTEEENGDLENAIIAFYKLAEHTSLAIIQYSSLYEETEEELEQYRTNIKRADEAIKDSNQLKNEMMELKSAMTVSSNSVQKMEEKYSNIYTDFIAILGVFSSFVFVMFGGFSALSEILGSLSQTNVSLGKVFLISSFLLGTVFTIIYALLLWVSKITDKPIAKQICDDCRPNSCKKLWHAVKRHKFYCIIILTMSLLFLSGLIMIIYFPKI
ncbi:hypothetical protein [Streptococcus gallolyticus]|uniref:hypothetical protein n=1 Tax=Streptococcus gallolyticus TaxID=315405 RepID=UPI0034A4E771